LSERFGLKFQPDFFTDATAVSLLNAGETDIILPTIDIRDKLGGGGSGGGGGRFEPDVLEQLSQARSRIQLLEQVERPVMIEREADALNEAFINDLGRRITDVQGRTNINRVYREISQQQNRNPSLPQLEISPREFQRLSPLERVRVASNLLPGGSDELSRRLFPPEQ
jgi:hypothetical protein